MRHADKPCVRIPLRGIGDVSVYVPQPRHDEHKHTNDLFKVWRNQIQKGNTILTRCGMEQYHPISFLRHVCDCCFGEIHNSTLICRRFLR